EEDELLAARVRLVDPGPQLRDPVRLVGDGQHAGLLEIAVDRVGPGEGQQLLEVRPAEPFELVDLVGEVALAVGPSVDEARLAEATVPTARPEPDEGGLDDDDPQ